MEASNLIMFELDIASRTTRYAVHTQGAFALDDTKTKAPEGFIEQGTVCDDSIEDFKAMYQEMYDGAKSSSRIIHAIMNGQEVYNKIMLKAIKNKEGKSIKAIGIIQNVITNTIKKD